MSLHRAAKITNIPPGAVKVVELDDEQIALCNVDGHIYAIANLCTHDGSPLDQGCLDGHAIECPRHGARFDVRTGSVRALPAVIPVPTYPVETQGDDILVDLP
jgi:3-phenylpropionate/trans-cinnamate dioxygenase ferredoxin subunit